MTLDRYQIFEACVQALCWLAEMCGTDYRTINVVVFCVIGPFVFLFMCFAMYAFHQEAKHYKLCWELAMGRARSAEDNYKRLAASKVISSRLQEKDK